MIQSIQRAVAILRSFSEAEPELSVTGLSQRLGLPKSTVSRILATLQAEGLVGQTPITGQYHLGLGLISLAGVALGRLDVRGVAQPHLDALVAVSEETVHVTVLDGHECVTIDRAPGPHPIRYVGWIGRRTPLHCTASGKILLANLEPEKWEGILPASLVKYTDETITDRQVFAQSLARARQLGYAIVNGEFEAGFSSIAAPVRNHTGRVVAAIEIAGPTYRMASEHVKTLIEPLCQATRVVSTELGCLEP